MDYHGVVIAWLAVGRLVPRQPTVSSSYALYPGGVVLTR